MGTSTYDQGHDWRIEMMYLTMIIGIHRVVAARDSITLFRPLIYLCSPQLAACWPLFHLGCTVALEISIPSRCLVVQFLIGSLCIFPINVLKKWTAQALTWKTVFPYHWNITGPLEVSEALVLVRECTPDGRSAYHIHPMGSTAVSEKLSVSCLSYSETKNVAFCTLGRSDPAAAWISGIQPFRYFILSGISAAGMLSILCLLKTRWAKTKGPRIAHCVRLGKSSTFSFVALEASFSGWREILILSFGWVSWEQRLKASIDSACVHSFISWINADKDGKRFFLSVVESQVKDIEGEKCAIIEIPAANKAAFAESSARVRPLSVINIGGQRCEWASGWSQEHKESAGCPVCRSPGFQFAWSYLYAPASNAKQQDFELIFKVNIF